MLMQSVQGIFTDPPLQMPSARERPHSPSDSNGFNCLSFRQRSVSGGINSLPPQPIPRTTHSLPWVSNQLRRDEKEGNIGGHMGRVQREESRHQNKDGGLSDPQSDLHEPSLSFETWQCYSVVLDGLELPM